ncbi:MAG: hypothetical protein N2746_10075, partial [Deltaproteobacteria bacterium]|nr:hypothetical protein [Deltaproteobacteria bacterium]MCX7944839.1 hypothetical protein [Deltaproteobacteria bacterium]
IGLCMWYESKNHECSRIYDFVLMEDVGFKGGEKVECNLSNLNIVIQANFLTDITIDDWRLMLSK